MQWKKPEEEMPKDLHRVAVIVRTEFGKLRTAIAEHVSSHSIKSEDFFTDGCENSDLEEYDEKEDCYYVLENWFESNLCEETNYVLSYPVLVWAKIEIPEEIKIADEKVLFGEKILLPPLYGYMGCSCSLKSADCAFGDLRGSQSCLDLLRREYATRKY